MSDLTRRINDVSEAGYGLNILDDKTPAAVVGVTTNRTGIAADLPWGPYDAQTITSATKFFSTYAPSAFEAVNDYPSIQAFVNKTFAGPIVVKRIEADTAGSGTPAALASFTFEDIGTDDSVVVTARHAGVQGNKVSVEWVDGTAPGTQATAIVTVGTSYQRTYKDIVDGTTVTDPGDAFVSFEAAIGISARPATTAATALAGGSDGVIVAGDWTGLSGTLDGVRAFTAIDNPVDVIFGAEVPSAFVTSFNAALTDVVESVGLRGVLSTPADSTAAAIIATVSSGTRSERTQQPFPKGKTTNSLSATQETIVVDGNAFLAAGLSAVAPEASVASKTGRKSLQQMTGVEYSFTQAEYDLMQEAGIVPLYPMSSGGVRYYGARTTSLESGRTEGIRVAMADYILKSLSDFNIDYLGEALDVDVVAEKFGPVTEQQMSGMVDFMEGLKEPAGGSRIKDYRFDWFSKSTATDIAAGRWIIGLRVQMYNSQQEIVLVGSIGPSVQFEVL